MAFCYTGWRSMFAIYDPIPLREAWEELVKRFGDHVRLEKKELAEGFGPYTLVAPTTPCRKHGDGTPRPDPHRCDRCVEAITMLVFDVDTGTLAEVEACERRLNCTRLWYSTYSFRPESEKAAFRLVLPLAKPISPQAMAGVRLSIRREFAIPCDETACSGKSHYYHAPSCPPGATPIFDATAGTPVDEVYGDLFRANARPPVADLTPDMSGWSAPPEPEGNVDVGPLCLELEEYAKHLVYCRDPKKKHKGQLLRKCLAGRPLAEHGERNKSAFVVAGMLAWKLPQASALTLAFLMRPSVDAMITAGSSLTWAKVERMIESAMLNRATHDVEQKAFRARWASFRLFEEGSK